MIPFYEIRSVGNYCLASDIGAEIKNILNDDTFFLRRSSDGSERIGRWINQEAAEIFSKDRHNTVEAMDIISFKYCDNADLIDKLTVDGRIDPSIYRRHGKLDMYSVNLAELIIRSMTQHLDYTISRRVELIVDYRNISAIPVHNDIAMKYLFRDKPCLRLLTRKKILPSLHAVREDPIARAAEYKEDISAETRLMEAFESEDGVSRRYAGRNVIDMFPEAARRWIRLYFKVCKSTLDIREKLFEDGVEDIEKWASTIIKEYHE